MKQTIRHIFGSTFTVATIFLAAGCSEYNPEEFNGNLTKEEYEKISEYTQNFTLRYGKMDPDHDWGFGELAPKGSKGVKGTRIFAEPSTQSWFNDGSTIPGIPSPIDGKYHYVSNSNQHVTFDTSQGEVDQHNPIGDVTDEEIIYVSNYFRNNTQFEGQKEVNLQDFYIQNISQDCDRVSYPDGQKKPLPNENLTYQMDKLMVVQSGGHEEHCSNFNDGNSNRIEENLPAQDKLYDNLKDPTGMGTLDFCKYRTIMRMKKADWQPDQSPVTSFYVQSSNGDNIIRDYVLVHLEFEGPKSGKHYSGDYLAFDYSIHKQDGSATMERDGYYSNWILKISPAYPSTTPDDPTPRITTTETARVMCEDLGSTNDFDFNDLVFDVYYTYEGTEDNKSDIQAHITLQAVGGTLPIYIGAQTTSDPTKELHYRMTNTNAKNPINVGAGTTHSPVTFTMSATSTDPNALDICVGSSDNKATDYIILPSSGNSNLAPQKICVPTTVRWLRESQQIEWGYTKFKDWVNSQKQNPFWNDGINESYLY